MPPTTLEMTKPFCSGENKQHFSLADKRETAHCDVTVVSAVAMSRCLDARFLRIVNMPQWRYGVDQIRSLRDEADWAFLSTLPAFTLHDAAGITRHKYVLFWPSSAAWPGNTVEGGGPSTQSHRPLRQLDGEVQWLRQVDGEQRPVTAST